MLFGLPPGEHQNGPTALQDAGQDLGPRDAEADTTILNRRDRGLRNAGELGELILAEFLQLVNNVNRGANRNLYTTLGGKEPTHYE